MVQDKKKELRKLVKKLKENHKPEAYFSESAEIIKIIEHMPYFIDASVVMVYWSIRGEVFTHDFIRRWCHAKQIILPSVEGDTMNMKVFKDDSILIPGDLYQIPEPDGPAITETGNIDMIIIPGVAFDHNNNRLGRGKAYYDRFLQSTNAMKLGVCFRFQLFDEIPTDEYDIKMDMVITNGLRMQ